MNPTHGAAHQNGPPWRRAQQQPAAPYAGYGLTPPDMSQQGNLQAMQGCIQAIADMLGSTLQVSDLAPWIHVPYRGRRLCEFVKCVLSVDATVDAATNAAGIVLAAALNSVVPGSVTLLEMATATSWVDLFTFAAGRSTENYFESWGISQQNHVNEALDVGLMGQSAGGLPSPPDPSLSAPPVHLHQPANLMTAESAEFKIRVRLLDITTPLIVSLGVCHWTYPVTQRRDSRDRNATNLRSSYGLDCGQQR